MVYADSSAALAIAKRKGAGKLRHINVSSLWIQERQDKEYLELRKVLGTENPADMMTKHLARSSVDKCMCQISQDRAGGRAESGLEVQGSTRKPDGSPGGKAAPPATSNNAPGLGPAPTGAGGTGNIPDSTSG